MARYDAGNDRQRQIRRAAAIAYPAPVNLAAITDRLDALYDSAVDLWGPTVELPPRVVSLGMEHALRSVSKDLDRASGAMVSAQSALEAARLAALGGDQRWAEAIFVGEEFGRAPSHSLPPPPPLPDAVDPPPGAFIDPHVSLRFLRAMPIEGIVAARSTLEWLDSRSAPKRPDYTDAAALDGYLTTAQGHLVRCGAGLCLMSGLLSPTPHPQPGRELDDIHPDLVEGMVRLTAESFQRADREDRRRASLVRGPLQAADRNRAIAAATRRLFN